MTSKQKCEKLARVLETVASKLREPELGVKIWEENEPTMQALVAQVHMFLKRAMEIDSAELPNTSTKKRKTKNMDEDEQKDFKLLHDWPDILS